MHIKQMSAGELLQHEGAQSRQIKPLSLAQLLRYPGDALAGHARPSLAPKSVRQSRPMSAAPSGRVGHAGRQPNNIKSRQSMPIPAAAEDTRRCTPMNGTALLTRKSRGPSSAAPLSPSSIGSCMSASSPRVQRTSSSSCSSPLSPGASRPVSAPSLGKHRDQRTSSSSWSSPLSPGAFRPVAAPSLSKHRDQRTSSSSCSSPLSPASFRPVSAPSLRKHQDSALSILSTSCSSSMSPGASRPVSAPSSRMQQSNASVKQAHPRTTILQSQLVEGEQLASHMQAAKGMKAMAKQSMSWLDELPQKERILAKADMKHWVESEGMDWEAWWQWCKFSQKDRKDCYPLQALASPAWRVVEDSSILRGRELQPRATCLMESCQTATGSQPKPGILITQQQIIAKCPVTEEEWCQLALESTSWHQLKSEQERPAAMSTLRHWLKRLEIDWDRWWSYCCRFLDSGQQNALEQVAQPEQQDILQSRKLIGSSETVRAKDSNAPLVDPPSTPLLHNNFGRPFTPLLHNNFGRSARSSQILEQYAFEPHATEAERQVMEVYSHVLAEAWVEMQQSGTVEDFLAAERKERSKQVRRDYKRELFPTKDLPCMAEIFEKGGQVD